MSLHFNAKLVDFLILLYLQMNTAICGNVNVHYLLFGIKTYKLEKVRGNECNTHSILVFVFQIILAEDTALSYSMSLSGCRY